MVELGNMNRLQVARVGAYDTYLDGGALGEVLLLDKSQAEPASEGDQLDVFVCIDIDDTVVATTKRPHALVGECASLKVVNLSKSGAYLDWGLKSDLFVPRSEQLGEMAIGSTCVAYVMLDKTSQRMIASTRLYKYLKDENQSDFKDGQKVELLISQKTDLGYKAVINGTHLGLLYANEVFTELKPGDGCDGYINGIRVDLKIDLKLQKNARTERSELESRILTHLQSQGGESTLTDKSPPEAIYKTYAVSKKAYKNALGGLYRGRLIVLAKDKITLADKAG